MSDNEKQHNLDNEKEQNISESFWVFSVSGTGGKTIPGREIKEIQFLGVENTDKNRTKMGYTPQTSLSPISHCCICPRSLE